MKEVEESSMVFLVDEEDCFLLEKSQFVDSLSGKKKCEFISLNPPSTLTMIEAKTSFSNPNTEHDYSANIQEIINKFDDSIQIVNAVLLRHEKEEMKSIGIPAVFSSVNLHQVEYLFFLIVKNHHLDWLSQISNTLKSKMKPLFRLWNIPDTSLKVLNEELARRRGLIK